MSCCVRCAIGLCSESASERKKKMLSGWDGLRLSPISWSQCDDADARVWDKAEPADGEGKATERYAVGDDVESL